MSRVLVFKTSVASLADLLKLQPLLDTVLEGSGCWNFDLDDCDRVLRVEGDTQPRAVIQTLASAGFQCEELSD
ncbi:MAG: hypothetical protein JST06_05775 [Bacteroidetes bacterium]|nr:hypothetical protein [Bacteroidota bacterium]MBS1629041.1 hypothetical protein [Bacteroidota bacterium]